MGPIFRKRVLSDLLQKALLCSHISSWCKAATCDNLPVNCRGDLCYFSMDDDIDMVEQCRRCRGQSEPGCQPIQIPKIAG